MYVYTMRYDIRLELIYERHMQAEQKEKQQQQQHELRKLQIREKRMQQKCRYAKNDI